MAKRKKTPTRRRRSRVGFTGGASNIFEGVGGIVIGVAAAGYATKLLLKNQSDTIKAAAPVVVGFLLPNVIKSNIGKSIGNGMIAFGAAKFLQQAGLGGDEFAMAGDADIIELPVTMSGDGEISVLAGEDDFAMAGNDMNLSALAGFEDDNF